ncbi:MAG: phosphoribosyltransferase family protein [Pseudomonadota bacterium]|nr:phosphoribosyltransferase family protein [Pseudomonadota bacterium]
MFRDREDAGQQLAQSLLPYRGQDVVVLALPRGGVPIGYELARALGAPLDVFLARKLGAPMHPELGMGAITEGGLRVLDNAIVRLVGATPEQLNRVVEREEAELRRRTVAYRGARPLPDVTGKVVILVDDGIATGGTARAALRDLRQRGPKRLILATPVGARDACLALSSEADEVVCIETPAWFHAIGEWYEDFRQLDDSEVIELLDRARREWRAQAPAASSEARPASSGVRPVAQPTVAPPPVPQPTVVSPPPPQPMAATRPAPAHVPQSSVLAPPAPQPRTFRLGTLVLDADVCVPAGPRGVILFSHGSGSSRHSPRNRAVANTLVDAGFATVLLDLLTPAEEALDVVTARLRFDIGLLSRRLVGVIDELGQDRELRALPIGIFGASTGAASALVAAAARPDQVRAVVSRGGRPDLAGDALPRVRAPVLLIVGGRDAPVLDLNRTALRALRSHAVLTIVPGATHLFEEPGTLEEVGRLATAWFGKQMAGVPEPA